MTAPRDPVLEVIRALQKDWENGQPDAWENWTIPQYLDAMDARLEVYERSYANTGWPVPTDGCGVFAEALRAGRSTSRRTGMPVWGAVSGAASGSKAPPARVQTLFGRSEARSSL